ncbi:MAG: flavodoxin family protein [Desulfobulbaceae bacterium]|nr:flavodoxin family protein [Desulfobulbaceae bacterium]
MLKVLAFNGSPRRKGNTEVLLAAVEKGILSAGGEMEIVRLADLDISPCISCGGCDKTGVCVVEDGMTALYEKIDGSRRIILASPIYFYSITAQAKAFVDRSQAMWSKKYLLKKKGEWQEDPDRLGYFVSVAATRGEKIFEGAELTARYFYDAIGFHYCNSLLVKGIDKRGEMAAAEEKIKAGEEFGRKIAAGDC